MTDINFNLPTRTYDKKAQALLDKAGWVLSKDRQVRQKRQRFESLL